MKNFFFNRKALGVVLMVLVIHLLLAYASFGPTATSELKEMPIGFLNSDEGMAGENLGLVFEKAVTGADSEMIKWINYDSLSAMHEAFENKELYGGLVLPPNLTESIFSMQGEAPQQAMVKVILNEGMNVTGANTVQTIIAGTLNEMNQEIRNDMLGNMQNMGLLLQPEQVSVLAEPLVQQVEKVNPVGGQARGQLPLIFTVLLWLGSLIGSLLIWLMLHSKDQLAARFVGTQLLSGVFLAVIQAFSTMAVVGWLMGMELVNYGYLIMFLMITAFVFFLIQSSVLNWLGFKGWPLLILIWLFGLPVVSLPPEFLSNFYKSAIYSWIPFRFSVEGLSSTLFFDAGGNLSSMLAVLAVIGAVFLLLILASYYRLKNQDLSVNPMARRFEVKEEDTQSFQEGKPGHLTHDSAGTA